MILKNYLEFINEEKEDDEEYLISVSNGIIEVQPDSKIYILADTAERAEDIDIKMAEDAMKSAQRELSKKEESMEDIDFARLQAVIDRELARIQVGKKYRDLRRRN